MHNAYTSAAVALARAAICTDIPLDQTSQNRHVFLFHSGTAGGRCHPAAAAATTTLDLASTACEEALGARENAH